MKVYKDKFGNTATIEECLILPYNGAKHKVKGFRLILSADYDNAFIYHVSVHEEKEDAISEMLKNSCGEWKNIL